MKVWDKLSEVDIDNKELFQNLFSEIVAKIQRRKFELKVGETEKENYHLIIEENRMNSYFVHIVPKQAYSLFREIQKQAPNQFLGFSVVAGKHGNKDVRVSCFGIQCNLLGKSLIKNNQK